MNLALLIFECLFIGETLYCYIYLAFIRFANIFSIMRLSLLETLLPFKFLSLLSSFISLSGLAPSMIFHPSYFTPLNQSFDSTQLHSSLILPSFRSFSLCSSSYFAFLVLLSKPNSSSRS